MSVSTDRQSASYTIVVWLGRLVGLLFLLFGVLATYSSFFESSEVGVGLVAILDTAGALAYILSLERPQHPLSRWARVGGWLAMAGFSIFIPTSLLFLPRVIVLLALPSLFMWPRKEADA